MASKVFDTAALDDFANQMQRTAQQFERKKKPFMRKEGAKLKAKTQKKARMLGKKTGSYLKSIKRGKAYEYDGAQAIRVYSAAPHAHLLEDGHRMVTRGGQEVGFVPGHHVFETAAKEFEPQYLSDLDDLLDELVDSI